MNLRESLIEAARHGNIAAVRDALEKGANINAIEYAYGCTALMYASRNGHMDIVKLLIEKDADINAKDDVGATAFMHASRTGHTPEFIS